MNYTCRFQRKMSGCDQFEKKSTKEHLACSETLTAGAWRGSSKENLKKNEVIFLNQNVGNKIEGSNSYEEANNFFIAEAFLCRVMNYNCPSAELTGIHSLNIRSCWFLYLCECRSWEISITAGCIIAVKSTPHPKTGQCSPFSMIAMSPFPCDRASMDH